MELPESQKLKAIPNATMVAAYRKTVSWTTDIVDTASATHLKDARDVHLHFDPEGDTAMLFQKWKRLGLFFKAVSESDIERQEKRRLYRILGVRARWGRRGLASDIVEAAQWRWRSWTSAVSWLLRRCKILAFSRSADVQWITTW